MNDNFCRLCKKPIQQGEPTGTLEFQGKRYPSVNSPNYDDRYGHLVHSTCLAQHYAKRTAKEQKHG